MEAMKASLPLPQLEEWEIWTVASKVLESHGDEVGDYLVERLQSMMETGDQDGIDHWMRTAACVRRLQKPDDDVRMN